MANQGAEVSEDPRLPAEIQVHSCLALPKEPGKTGECFQAFNFGSSWEYSDTSVTTEVAASTSFDAVAFDAIPVKADLLTTERERFLEANPEECIRHPLLSQLWRIWTFKYRK